MTYLAVCCVYRDEAPFFREWIEFHRLVGVERFFLYDNLSRDEHLDVLGPYIDEGIVVRHEWPIRVKPQLPCFEDCVRTHREDARWIAFIDPDEFLFSPTGASVAELLRDYEEAPAVGANWCIFGSSGHETNPDGLVIENYLIRGDDSFHAHKHVKLIADPSRVVRCATAHQFEYTDGALAVDENKQPLEFGWTEEPSFSKLRVNHYLVKSRDDWRRKNVERRCPASGDFRMRRWEKFDHLEKQLAAKRDETITRYLPELRAALVRKLPQAAA
jgi:hypothetical protein